MQCASAIGSHVSVSVQTGVSDRVVIGWLITASKRGLTAAVVHKTLYAIGGSNGTKALDTVEDADLGVAEAANCGGVMLENMWQTGPFSDHVATGPCRGGDGRFLYAIRDTRSAATVEGDRS